MNSLEESLAEYGLGWEMLNHNQLRMEELIESEGLGKKVEFLRKKGIDVNKILRNEFFRFRGKIFITDGKKFINQFDLNKEHLKMHHSIAKYVTIDLDFSDDKLTFKRRQDGIRKNEMVQHTQKVRLEMEERFPIYAVKKMFSKKEAEEYLKNEWELFMDDFLIQLNQSKKIEKLSQKLKTGTQKLIEANEKLNGADKDEVSANGNQKNN